MRILRADGFAVNIHKAENENLTATLEGKTSGHISFFSPGKPTVYLEGKEVMHDYDAKTGTGTVPVEKVRDGKVSFEMKL